MTKNILRKTLGGLSLSYYLRNLFFGAIFAGLMIALLLVEPNANSYPTLGYLIICVFLYPYSRFVYDQIIGFIMGDNVFIMNILFVFFIKLITISLCLLFAPIIAPLGLMYLYFYHTKNKTFEN